MKWCVSQSMRLMRLQCEIKFQSNRSAENNQKCITRSLLKNTMSFSDAHYDSFNISVTLYRVTQIGKVSQRKR